MRQRLTQVPTKNGYNMVCVCKRVCGLAKTSCMRCFIRSSPSLSLSWWSCVMKQT